MIFISIRCSCQVHHLDHFHHYPLWHLHLPCYNDSVVDQETQHKGNYNGMKYDHSIESSAESSSFQMKTPFVKPNLLYLQKKYRGIALPTTPATTVPVAIPARINICSPFFVRKVCTHFSTSSANRATFSAPAAASQRSGAPATAM